MADSGRGDNGGSTTCSRRQDKVLCIGCACVDFVNITDTYPQEDSDQRGIEYYWQRGGNATNNCTILSILSIPCEFLGVLGSHGVEASWLKNDFDKWGIETSNCLVKPVQCPVANIVISCATGSRTILFYPRNRPELTYNEFHQIFHDDFSQYCWIHFELRSTVEDISHMVDDVLRYNERVHTAELLSGQNSRIIISLEVEKPELQNPESVMCKADIVFISKDFAKMKGYSNPCAAVEGLYNLCKDGAILICAWGDVGASAHCQGNTLTVSSLTDIKVIDTLGAGDTFVAGVIASLWKKRWTSRNDDAGYRSTTSIRNALEFGCHVAGLKCTIFGYQGLRQLIYNIS